MKRVSHGPRWRWLPIACALAVACGDDAGGAAPASDAASAMDGGGTSAPDAASPDAAEPPPSADAAIDADTPGADAGSVPDAAPSGDDAGDDPGMPVPPETLEETGLYRPGSTSELADGVMPFEPRYFLWSDGAEKRRWLYLPPGSRIDTSDMDNWRFPEGTKAWKEFSRDGKKLETRLLWKSSQGWFMMAFAWNDAETEAVAVPEGVLDARGTAHDIPEAGDCRTCHDGASDALLGPSAIQLSHDEPDVNLEQLATDGWLTDPPPSGDFRLPAGDDWQALGYLHANCGNCHNPNGVAFDRAEGMQLWLTVDSVSGAVVDTPTYTTTVGVTPSDDVAGFAERIAAGSAADSVLVHRMEIARGDDLAMPPLATEQVDTPNVDRVKAWIDGL